MVDGGDDKPWTLERQSDFLNSFRLHHSDSMDLFQMWYQFGGYQGSLSIADAWTMFHDFPETRRRDIVAIATYLSAMQKLKNTDD